MPQLIQVSASAGGTLSKKVRARDCSGRANSRTTSIELRPIASVSKASINAVTCAMTAGSLARLKKGSTISRYSVWSGGLVSMGSCRMVRTPSSDGIGTRKGASEL